MMVFGVDGGGEEGGQEGGSGGGQGGGLGVVDQGGVGQMEEMRQQLCVCSCVGGEMGYQGPYAGGFVLLVNTGVELYHQAHQSLYQLVIDVFFLFYYYQTDLVILCQLGGMFSYFC